MAVTDYEGIVLLGVPRSVTTLTRRLVDSHPAIACPPETGLLSAAARFLREDTFQGGRILGVVPGLAHAGFTEAQVLERLREFTFRFLREAASRQGKQHWAEKSATDIFYLDAIERLCGDHCRFVGIVRHPLDVVCSTTELTLQMGMYLPELYAYVQRWPSPQQAFAHAWNDANRRLMDFARRRPDACLLVRYEDLTADPLAEMMKMCEFFGEATDVGQLLRNAFNTPDQRGLGDWKTQQTRRVESTSVGRWRQLPTWTVEQLTPIVEATMVELGYEPWTASVDGPRAPATPGRSAEPWSVRAPGPVRGPGTGAGPSEEMLREQIARMEAARMEAARMEAARMEAARMDKPGPEPVG